MKKILKKIIILIVILMVASYSNISLADNMTDLKNEKNDIKNEISATQNKIDDISDEREETLKQVEKLIDQISNYQTEIDNLSEKITKIQGDITVAEAQIKQDEEDYQKKYNELGERIVASYKAGRTSYLNFILSSDNIIDMISRYFLISKIAKYDQKMMEQLTEHKEKIEREKAKLESDKKELDSSKVTLLSKKQGLEVTKKTKEQYVSQLSEKEKKLEAELSELTNHEQSINKKIKELQEKYDRERAEAARKAAEEARKAEAAKNQNSNSGTSTTSKTSNLSSSASSNYGFGWPVANPVIGTAYGVSGSYWSSGHHTGVDFRASIGTPVYAVGEGQVVDTGRNGAYGYFVEIYHGNNIYSFYAHASRVIVSTGQYVNKGQQIMYSGDTGNVTGPHLHFEIRTPGPRYANCVNPMKYLP